jgi:hypothetical protein
MLTIWNKNNNSIYFCCPQLHTKIFSLTKNKKLNLSCGRTITTQKTSEEFKKQFYANISHVDVALKRENTKTNEKKLLNYTQMMLYVVG